jgi:hypothetical protein
VRASVLLLAGLACSRSPTFAREVAPLVHRRCAPCHRPGEAGPFPLITYDDVSRRAAQIARVTASRFMPPWKPVPGHVRYANDRSLSAEEIALFQRWAAAGAPAGGTPPAPPAWPVGWQLGQPDLVVELPVPYPLAAEGSDVYRNVVIRPPPGGTRYVAAWELRPESRTIHHAILNVDRTGWARARDAQDPEPGYPGMDAGQAQSPDGFYLVWTPGKSPTPPAPGSAWILDDRTDLVLQLHMQPSGKPERVQPRIGLYFTREAPTRPRVSLRIGDPPIDIAAGVTSYRIGDRYTFPAEAVALGIFPHAHYLATRMRCWLTMPDGSRRWLLYIDDWDFAWQEEYVFAEPVKVPAGARLEMEFFYDNSASNVRNPSRPPRRVRSGERSLDEMGNVTLQLAPEPAAAEVLRESKYRRLLGGGPDARAEYNLGNALMRQGRLDEAIVRFRQALAIDPGLVVAHVNLASAQAARGHPAEAVAACQQALALKPRDPVALTTLGMAYEALGQQALATAQYRRALEIDPGYGPARARLAR